MALAISANGGANVRASYLHRHTRRHALRLSQPHTNARSLTSGSVAIPALRGVVSRAISHPLSQSAHHLFRRTNRF